MNKNQENKKTWTKPEISSELSIENTFGAPPGAAEGAGKT